MIGIKKINPAYVILSLIIVLAILSFFILKPFINTLIGSLLLAYIFNPLFKKINKRIKSRNLLAAIFVICIVLIFLLPLAFILKSITQEAYAIYIYSKQTIISQDLLNIDCETTDNFICSISNVVRPTLENANVQDQIQNTVQRASSWLISIASGFLMSVPSIILNFFIFIFALFYLTRDGHKLMHKLEKTIPLNKSYKKKILKQFNNLSYAILHGHVLVALIQGTLGGLGFLFLGVPSPFLWGLVMAILALLPFVGPPIVWLPASLILLLNGYITSDSTLIIKGIILLIYGTLIVSTIDNILKPKLIGDKAKIHPLTVLLGVTGGLFFFGFIGLFIGPIILSMFITLTTIYFKENEAKS